MLEKFKCHSCQEPLLHCSRSLDKLSVQRKSERVNAVRVVYCVLRPETVSDTFSYFRFPVIWTTIQGFLMKAKIPYRCEYLVRPICVVLLFACVGFWFGFFGWSLILQGEPFTLRSGIGTAAFALVACLIVVVILKGGTQHIEINDEGVHWHDPFAGSGGVRDADVESFEIVQNSGGFDTAGFSTIHIFLKSGAVVYIPRGCIHNERLVWDLLMKKWRFRGWRRVG